MSAFRPPPPTGLELQRTVVSIAQVTGGVVVTVDSVRCDDPHDLAYASLVIRRLLGEAALRARINGAIANPIVRLAEEPQG